MKPSVLADTIGVAIFASIATIPLSCVPLAPPVVEREDLQPLVAVAGNYSILASGSAAPAPPSSGCEAGCKCSGTGIEKSGDGLANVSCRCPETCSCKAKKTASVVAPSWPTRNLGH